MYDYKVIEVNEWELEEEINEMAKEGWEFCFSIVNKFHHDSNENICDTRYFEVDSYNLVFKKQK